MVQSLSFSNKGERNEQNSTKRWDLGFFTFANLFRPTQPRIYGSITPFVCHVRFFNSCTCGYNNSVYKIN